MTVVILVPLVFVLMAVGGALLLAWATALETVLYRLACVLVDALSGLFPDISRWLRPKMQVTKMGGKYRITDRKKRPIRSSGHALDNGGYSEMRDAFMFLDYLDKYRHGDRHQRKCLLRDRHPRQPSRLAVHRPRIYEKPREQEIDVLRETCVVAILLVPIAATAFANGIWIPIGMLASAMILYLIYG